MHHGTESVLLCARCRGNAPDAGSLEAMKHRTERTFAAPIDAVWTMICDPDAQLAMFERMGYRDIELVEHRLEGDHLHLVTRRSITLDLPGFARRVLRPTNTMHSVDDWHLTTDRDDGGATGATGAIAMRIDGAPVAIDGTVTLTPEGDSTVYAITIDVDVRVPVVGRKIAAWALRDVERQFALQFEAADGWLGIDPDDPDLPDEADIPTDPNQEEVQRRDRRDR